MSEQRKGRFMLVMLVLVFALPVLGVVILHSADWRPGGKSHGELMQPSRALDFPLLNTAGNKPFTAPDWHRKWHMVYITAATCDQNCRDALHTMRQLHASLAKEIDRIERVWLIAGAVPTDQVSQLRQVQRDYPDLIVLPDAAALTTQFNLSHSQAASGERVYLVDPMGHLMMSYPRGADPYGMRKDLVRVLTYSWTG
ncbi:MAG TPA: hypothetical protein VGK14_04590 [Novimethylophilus sp.]|uniref:SCO family protein n=1 Tax=Novimethylophilus sp. TaxID=2137426 RepID=UPI002F3F7087